MWTMLRQISLRHLYRTPARSLLVALGIALGVALYVSTRATSDSLVVTFEKMVDQVSGKADVTLVGRTGGVPNGLTAEISDLEGVDHASSVVEITLRDPARNAPLLILGVDFLGDPYFLPFDVQDGETQVVEDPLSFANDPYAILVSRTLAERRGLEVGDDLELVSSEGPKQFHVRGILDDSGPAAAFDGQVAVMFLDAAQVAFARGHQVDRIEIALDPHADRAQLTERIRGLVKGRAEVELPAARKRKVMQLLGPIRLTLWLSGVLALIVAMFLIYNAVGIAVAQRRPEVGLLRALGATRGSVLWVFCFESLALALPSSLLGLVAGRWLGDMAIEQTIPSISQLYVPMRPPRAQVGLELGLEAVGMGLLTTLLAALWPALRAAGVDPAECLRGRALTARSGGLPYRALLLGGVILAPLLLALAELRSVQLGVGLGIATLLVGGLIAPATLVGVQRGLGRLVRARPTLQLGLTNISRELERSAINVVALLAAVATSVMIGGWVGSMQQSVTDWFDAALTGDLVVSAGSPVNDQYNVPFSEEALAKIAEVEGLEDVLPYRFLEQTVDDTTVTLAGCDTPTYFRQLEARGLSLQIVDGPSDIGAASLVDEPGVLLSEAAARRLELGAGDMLRLDTPHGPATLPVRAVMADYFLDRPAALLDRRHLSRMFGDQSVDSINLFVKPGKDLDAVSQAVRAKLGGGDALFVMRARTLEDRILQTMEEGFGYGRAIELIALLVALMGVLGTMLAAVIDRTREIGVLRAIGASPRQVLASVVAEAGALGLAAACLGVLIGALQGAILITSVVGPGIEWDLRFVFPTETALRIAALVVLTAALAGLLPGRRAAHLDLKRALGYE